MTAEAGATQFKLGDRVTLKDRSDRTGLVEGVSRRRGRRVLVRWLDSDEVDLYLPETLLLVSDDAAVNSDSVINDLPPESLRPDQDSPIATVEPAQLGGLKVGDRVTPKHSPGSRSGVVEGFRKNRKTPVIVRWFNSTGADPAPGYWGVDALLLDEGQVATTGDTITTASGEATVTATEGEIVFANYGGTDQPHTVDGIIAIESDPLEGVTSALAEIVGDSPISDDPELDWLASRINLKHSECEQAIAQSIYAARDAGRLLIEARAKVKQRRSRNWLRWLNENFEGSQRSAYNYMAIAENWQEKIEPELTPNTLLGIGQALRLLSATEEDLTGEPIPIEEDTPEDDPYIQPQPVERDEALTTTLEPGDYVQVIADDDQFGRVAIVARTLPSFEIAIDFDDGLTLAYPRHLLRLHARQAQLPIEPQEEEAPTPSPITPGHEASAPTTPTAIDWSTPDLEPIPESEIDPDTQTVIEQICGEFGALVVVEVALKACSDEEAARAYTLASLRRYGKVLN